jgi:hypothetical protein
VFGTIGRFMLWKGVRLYGYFRLDNNGVLPDMSIAGVEFSSLA